MGKNKKKAKAKKVEDFKKVKLKVGKTLKKTRDTLATVASKTLTLTTQLDKTGHEKTKLEFLTPLRHTNTKIKLSALKSLQIELTRCEESNVREWLEASILNYVMPLTSDLEADVRNEVLSVMSVLMKNVTDVDLGPYFALIVGHITFGLTHVNNSIKYTALKMIIVLLESHPNLPEEVAKNLWDSVLEQSGVTSQIRVQKEILTSTIVTLLNEKKSANNCDNKSMDGDSKILHIDLNSEQPQIFDVTLIPNYGIASPFDFPLYETNQHRFEISGKQNEYAGPVKNAEIALKSVPKLWTFLIAFWTELSCKEQVQELRFTSGELETMENILKILNHLLSRTSELIKENEGSADSAKLHAMGRGFMTKKNVMQLSAVLPCGWMPNKDQKYGRKRPVWAVNQLLATVLKKCMDFMPLQAVDKWVNLELIEQVLEEGEEKKIVKNKRKVASDMKKKQKTIVNVEID